MEGCAENYLDEIAGKVREWMADRGNNAIAPDVDLPAFDAPLLGAASGDDPLFERMKRDIGPEFFWTPHDAYKQAFPGDDPAPNELSVIAWILPQTAHTRAAHKRAPKLTPGMPSIEWSRARHFGEKVNENLRRFVVAMLAERGVNALAPVLLPQWTRAASERYGFASSWSERHAAHACGLGTFGLSDGLITRAGKAIRVGSVVARISLPPTPRTYARHNAWCLHFTKGKCKACINRCPAGAITEAGHDKVKCKAYIRGVTAVHVEREQLGFKVSSCGLCQTGVPCEAGNPTAARRKGE